MSAAGTRAPGGTPDERRATFEALKSLGTSVGRG
jgi:hypothetical protein